MLACREMLDLQEAWTMQPCQNNLKYYSNRYAERLITIHTHCHLKPNLPANESPRDRWRNYSWYGPWDCRSCIDWQKSHHLPWAYKSLFHQARKAINIINKASLQEQKYLLPVWHILVWWVNKFDIPLKSRATSMPPY